MYAVTAIAATQDNRLALAKWIASVSWVRAEALTKSFRLTVRAMEMADDLLRGAEFKWYLNPAEVEAGREWCNIFLEPEQTTLQKWLAEQEGYYELLKRGAEGDAAAAIAYCKLDMEGLVIHGPIAP